MFGAPALLWLTPLAAVPVVFHFMNRRRRRTRRFSTLMFFHRADPKMSRRRKIHEWALLACRAALLALLFLALARPRAPRLGGLPDFLQGRARTVVVIDNSASMRMPADDGGEDLKLDVALDSARALLREAMRNGSAGLVLTVPDRMAEVPEQMTEDEDSLLDGLDRVRPTDARGNPALAISRAVALLEGGGGAVHVFTDLQEGEWSGEAAVAPSGAAAEIPVVLHRIGGGNRERFNVALTGVELPEGRFPPGRPVLLNVRLAHVSGPAGELRLFVESGEGARESRVVELPERGEVTVDLPLTLNEPGWSAVRVWLEGDDFTADNRLGLTVEVGRKQQVWFSGTARAFGPLPLAVSPTGTGEYSGLLPVFPEGGRWTAATEEDVVLTVATWGEMSRLGPEAAQSLLERIEAGGRLLVVPSADGFQGFRGPSWLGAAVEPAAGEEGELWTLKVLDAGAPLWARFRRRGGEVGFSPVSARKLGRLRLEGGDWIPLFGVSYEEVVLAGRPLGLGRVYVLGVGMGEDWSMLPFSRNFPVLIQEMAKGGMARDSGVGRVVYAAGSPLPLEAYPEGSGPVTLVSLDGEMEPLEGDPGRMGVPPRQGAYLLRRGEAKRPLPVMGDPGEGVPRYLSGEAEVPVLAEFSASVHDLQDGEDFARSVSMGREGRPLYPWLIVAAMGIWMLEGWLGAPVRQEARRRAAEAELDGKAGVTA